MQMEAIIPIVLSTVEILSVFALMLSLFRFKFLRYGLTLLWLSVPMSVVSYFIRSVPELDTFKPLIMYLLFFLAVKHLFGLANPQALIVTLIGYIGYGLMQSLLLYIFIAAKLVSMEDVVRMGPANYALQLASIGVTTGIVALMMRQRWGFSFISQHVRFKTGFSHIGLSLILLVSGVIVLFSLRSMSLLMVLALAVDFYLLIQFARNKELQEQ